MNFLNLVLALNFTGLTAAFTAVGLWKTESGSSSTWLMSRAGAGAMLLLAGGIALFVGGFYFVSPMPMGIVIYVGACVAVIATGILLRAFAPSTLRRSVIACSAVAALIVTSGVPGILQVYDWMDAQKMRESEQIALERRLNPDIRSVPRVELNTRGIKSSKPSSKNYQFNTDWVSRIEESWQKAMEPYKGKADLRYLEIGVYEGRSFFWMAENILTDPTTRLTGIDPFLDPNYQEGYKQVFYSNLKVSGIESRVEIIEGFSQIELRKLPLNSYDIIYIDGSHNGADVLEDGVLCWRILKDEGLLIFDDYDLHKGMKHAIDTFYTFNASHAEPVHVGWQVILKKRAIARSMSGAWE